MLTKLAIRNSKSSCKNGHLYFYSHVITQNGEESLIIINDYLCFLTTQSKLFASSKRL